ncbi:hypothetical protein WMY93_017858 [Mugilogobius chulae]|uniref:Uncharacterized protein n=1 Tax=Mugilogobius chulae TaxID=88201 RepID=A0AAW0NPX4_9GOBI
MEGPHVKSIKDKAGKTVRFRVASANSGRVLTEVFKDETGWSRSVSHSVDSDSIGSPDVEQDSPLTPSEANSHLNGLMVGNSVDESGAEPDELLMYASAKREMFSPTKGSISAARTVPYVDRYDYKYLPPNHPSSFPAYVDTFSFKFPSLPPLLLHLRPSCSILSSTTDSARLSSAQLCYPRCRRYLVDYWTHDCFLEERLFHSLVTSDHVTAAMTARTRQQDAAFAVN